MKEYRIPVSAPDLSDLERAYLLQAFDSTRISSTGYFVDEFERAFAGFTEAEHAITCANGTVALHLALLGLGVGTGDEVIVPSLTYVATANAATYVGAEPVFADCDSQSWNIDPASVARLIGPRTKAVIAVHLFGVPAEMAELRTLCRKHDLLLIEDASEAHGARIGGRAVGSFGDAATFSFYGNKILATGEGGMVCTHRADVAERIRTFRGQGADPRRQYWFEVTGYNYRMTNLACAIGLAQLERFRELHQRREQVRAWYEVELCPRSLRLLRQETPADSEPALWMYGVVLEEGTAARRDAIRAAIASEGIETRPFFTALHRLPMFRDCRTDAGCVCSLRLGECGIMLPTHTKLTREDVRDVVDSLARTVQATTRHAPGVPDSEPATAVDCVKNL